MWRDKTEDTISIVFKIEIVEYTDNPIPYFEARCEKLSVFSIGKSPCEAKENVIKLIQNSNFVIGK